MLVPLLIVVYLFVLDWRMALISLITLPLGMCAYLTVIKTYPEQYAGSVRITQKMNNAIVEYVGGIEVIKAFNQSAASYGKYSDAVMENAEYYYQWMKSCQWATAGFTSICPGVLITVLPAGLLFYAAGSLSAENLITIIILSLIGRGSGLFWQTRWRRSRCGCRRMLRSVGMKDREIDRMMAFESLQYGWTARLFGD